MKKMMLGLSMAALLWTQPLLAGSVNEGGDKQSHAEHGMVQQAQLGDRPMEEMAILTAPEVTDPESDQAAPPKRVRTRGFPILKPSVAKFLDEANKHEGEGKGMGLAITSLAFAFVGFLLGATVVLWPIGLLFCITSVVLGTFSIAFGKRGKGFAIAALVLSIFIMVLPMLAFALMLSTAL